ncbi:MULTISPECIES: terminase large subunit domain-containing protein [Rodentibacter]|uniref:terminase large subunit domain-containing protein n=1 Tax=Rodentibacter TaxID=1960084 RepID=UPI00109D010C|nr:MULTISPECIES: terminase family protein [Pasteurellaceae]MCR1838307.1 terminase family protein [Pasteurella caecimuris]MCU0107581.1 terminase family protein [Pasteurella caecimuris]NBH76263.1 terminase [Rodentibacter pneumotropicus]THA07173.1 terminase [Rodentibacter pneumotropicus]THA11395.1 terminase [Rodentibacter pneumotropicus]
MALNNTLLYDYQKRWLNDKSRFKVAMFARQTGKTFTTTFEIVLDCLEAEVKGERTRWVILSRGERQAKEAINEGVKRHLEALGIAFELLEIPFSPTINALEVIFPNGSKITALPANPDTARGFSANVFLDEFAFHQNSREIWKALFPVISAGWKLRVVSTPNGKGNKFYELMTDLDNDEWSRHQTDIYQAVADGLPRNIDQLRKGLNDEDAWAQEFELKWLDEASSWLSYDLIDGVEHPDAGKPEYYQGGACFVGMDIAARNDLTVIWVIELVGDVYWTREIVELKRVPLREQLEELNRVMKQYHVVAGNLDQTGMGEKMVEDAQAEHGKRIAGTLFNLSTKLKMATIGKTAFEDRKIRIPQGNSNLREDLHKLKKITGANGSPRFTAESDSNGHADRTWACFLALTAATEAVMQLVMAHSRRPRASRRMTEGY